MADLSGLKKRVDMIDSRLKTAHGARERESAALMEIWEQIRERFLDQNKEIAKLRDQVSDLEDTKDELLQMVHGLLAAVEGGLERMSDETVPQIRVMADRLLEDGADTATVPTFVSDTRGESLNENNENDELLDPSETVADEELEHSNFHSDLLNAIERSLEEAEEDVRSPARKETGVVKRRTKLRVKEPASPGIRNLIARIEGAVGSDLIEMSSPSKGDEALGDDLDDELTRDLREIEALRGELHGLRERIASGAR